MWYVIQTITGKEEELARAVSAYLSPALCEACFTVKRRFIKRLGGEWVTVKEILFPSSYNQVFFIENSRFSTFHISVNKPQL